MKNLLFFTLLASSTLSVCAQGTTGLVAHWDMNGGCTDVSGNGHDGHPNFVTPTAGAHGIPNTAYLFNGSTSFISASYAPDFNFTEFSLFATLRVDGFYSGLCESNYVLSRGGDAGTANWSIRFDDNAYNGCGILDTTKQVYISTAGTNAPASAANWQYSPNIIGHTWHKVTITYKSPTWKIYVDCNLVNTVTGSGLPMGADMDSVAIGKNIWNAAYPYPFKGAIDDIRVYNRALHDTEVAKYCDTCGFVMSQPSNATTGVGGSVSYVTSTNITSPSYQWQCDTGTGFYDLSTSSIYSGVNTATLTATGVMASMHGNLYRCSILNENGCAAVSDSASLIIVTMGSVQLTQEMVNLYPNPASTMFFVSISRLQANAHLTLFNALGQAVYSGETSSGLTVMDIAHLPTGIYILEVKNTAGNVRKLVTKR